MKKRGVRDQMVIATKYATAWRGGKDGSLPGELIINTGGLGTKSLRLSLDKSLENLQTSYIDLVSPNTPNKATAC
jgi:aryl-alcohol dehydrogenase-like predicted oxidoreductase